MNTIEHIGILVPHLEAAIERWSVATGYTFSPIVRYRTDRWVDEHRADPHHHDARIAFSREGPPRLELMEATGAGTLGPGNLGVHHLGFADADPAAGLAGWAGRTDGYALDDLGRMLVCFSRPLDGVRLELVSGLPNPIVSDDGAPLPRHPQTGRVDIWAVTG